MLSTALGRFRLVALFEGASYLLLLGVAMPLKYLADSPEMVSWVGMAHGWLFILYVITGAWAAYERRWSPYLMTAAFMASLLPFATFYLDYWLRKQQDEESQAA
jgi:integral membrane protein